MTSLLGHSNSFFQNFFGFGEVFGGGDFDPEGGADEVGRGAGGQSVQAGKRLISSHVSRSLDFQRGARYTVSTNAFGLAPARGRKREAVKASL